MMDRWPTEAPASMTVGGTRVPRDGWYSSTIVVGDMRAEGSMEGGSLGMVDDEGGGDAVNKDRPFLWLKTSDLRITHLRWCGAKLE